jgi:glycerophosphoryl diester phosphodiesterase
VKSRYDYKESIRLVHELVMKYGIEGKCCVSSFNHDLLAHLEILNQHHKTHVDSIYLYNYYNSDELPHPDIYSTLGSGINISSVKLTREVVQICHAKGKEVGVWIDRDLFSENDEFYHTIYHMGVDFFCSDYPHLVVEALRKFENQDL